MKLSTFQKWVIAIIVGALFFTFMDYTQPVIKVNSDNMVVEVNGEETYRPLYRGDYEAKVIRVK